MTRSEILAILANTPDDELGDMLVELAVQEWRDKGATNDDILFVVESVLEEE